LDDFDPLYAVARDPLIWEQHPVRDRHRPEPFRAFFDDAIQSGGALAVETIGGALIGSSRFHGFDPARREVEIGWTFLARSYWGGNTNGELKSLMLDHAFQSVERVIFLVGPRNLRSQNALKKLGATVIGERADGSGLRNVLFAIRRGDWLLRQRSLDQTS
jgi:RimJ/RimL family protein N-acetyltransferase